MHNYDMEPDSAFRTPGQLIDKLLAERDWTQDYLAYWLKLSGPTISKMISGARPIDASTALILGEIFDINPERILRLQHRFDLEKARITANPDPTRTAKANLFGNLPVADMIKRGWLDVENVKDVEGVERELKKFFGVSDLNQVETLPHAAKKTNVIGQSTEKMTADAQMVWIYRVKKVAEQMMVAPYSQVAVRRLIKNLEPLMVAPESVRKVPKMLAEAGIRFVVMESIGKAKIDGVCFWLDQNSPVIGMTLRYDRIDNFWFVLRHELEHVDKMHGRADETVRLDSELEGVRAGVGQDVDEEERVANEAAANFGFTQLYLQKFISRKAPFFRELDVVGFANTVKVHPGIVVGRLQHATGRYDLLRKHLAGVRSHIVPSAMSDGWGDMAPIDYDD
jgi:HTH-type transcriptional regulator / antitoxin HigA